MALAFQSKVRKGGGDMEFKWYLHCWHTEIVAVLSTCLGQYELVVLLPVMTSLSQLLIGFSSILLTFE